MTVQELLEELARPDIRLQPAGDKLRVDAPKGVLTDGLREAIRRHKAQLLCLLTYDSLDSRRDPTTGAWLRDPGWWRSIPGQRPAPPKVVGPAPLPPAEGREPSHPLTLALSLRRNGTCYLCGGSTWWVSVYGVLVCCRCHPPPAPGLVAHYVSGEEAQHLPAKKTTL